MVKTITLSNGANKQDITGGFFYIHPASGKDLAEAAKYQTNGSPKLYPFGSKPEFQPTKVAGQNAMLIIPSDDQTGGTLYPKGARAVVIEYPAAHRFFREIPCGKWECNPGETVRREDYSYVVIVADKDNLQSIIDSVNFVSTNTVY
jgi:hypothetical protein